MKVGLLTFIHTRNFGANLQCYALQETIKEITKDVDVIDLYRPCDNGYVACKNDKTQFDGLYKFKSIKDFRSKLNSLLVDIYNFITKRSKATLTNDGFQQFRDKYISFSDEEYRNITSLYEQFPTKEYSHIVVGSDQVWNYATDFSKEPFFLTFCSEVKKLSYAASIGHSSIPDSVGVKYSKWLKDFSAISVRENTGVKAIAKLTDRDVVQTLDPTLLLNANEWISKLSIKITEKKDIVLVYMLSVSTKILTLAHEIAVKLNCPIKVITNRPYYRQIDNCIFLRNENPKSFVELYSRAKFVVTNSFHGTAFAINFNIPFITIEKKNSRLNSRKGSLLELLKLQDRLYFEDDTINVDAIVELNFDNANGILEKERIKSLQFLNNALK